jgi:glycosyltransferase involved in cell wall biosynthesis
MRIAQVMAGAEAGGIEMFFERLTPALARSGHDTLAAIRRDPARAERLAKAGITPLQFGFGGFFDFVTTPRLRRAFKQFMPDVVIGWMNRANRHIPNGPYKRIGRPGGYYSLKYYKDVDYLAYTTHGLVDWAIGQGWPSSRVQRVPNFVEDPVDITPLSRAALGIPEGVPLALSMGRLHQNKNFPILLRAVTEVPDLYLLLAGKGPEETALNALIHELGLKERVRMLGWRDDGAALRATVDMCIVPSDHEPFGNVVPEAWASHVPLITTDSQGPAEIVANGIDALMVPRKDSSAMAAAIRRIIAEPSLARALREEGRRKFEAEYSEAAVVQQWNDFLQEVAA